MAKINLLGWFNWRWHLTDVWHQGNLAIKFWTANVSSMACMILQSSTFVTYPLTVVPVMKFKEVLVTNGILTTSAVNVKPFCTAAVREMLIDMTLWKSVSVFAFIGPREVGSISWWIMILVLRFCTIPCHALMLSLGGLGQSQHQIFHQFEFHISIYDLIPMHISIWVYAS